MAYKILKDGELFCTSNTEQTSLLDPVVTLEVNKAGTLTFTMMPDNPFYDSIELRQSIFDVYQNGELIFEGIPVSEEVDFFNRKTVSCEGELTFLNDTIQRQAKYTDQTVSSLLGAYLAIHNAQADNTKQFTVGSVTVNGGNSILRYTNYQNTMTEIGEDLIDNFGGFLRVRHNSGIRYLDYLDASPRASSQVIRLGKNLLDLNSNLSSLDICTVLIPLGAKQETQAVEGLDDYLTIKSVNSGLDYLVGTAQAYYGNVWKTVHFDDVTTASALKSKGQDYLDDVQWANLVINATALDLGLTDEDVQQFRVLDTIRVISDAHGLDRNFLLSKLQINLNHPADTKIQLGMTQKLSLSARAVKNTQEVEKLPTTILVNASENARQILESATGGCVYSHYDQYGVCDEIRIMNSNDPSTATKWWRWNINGWGYTSDAGSTYTIAATMDGVLLASMIKTGILQSDNGEFSLNLDTGHAALSDVDITGGSLNINNNFTVDSQGNASANSLALNGDSTVDVYSTDRTKELHLDDDGFWAYDQTADHKIEVTQDGIHFGTGTFDYFRVYDNNYGGSAEIYTNTGAKLELQGSSAVLPYLRIKNQNDYRLVFIGSNTGHNGYLNLADQYGTLMTEITDGILSLYYNGTLRARIGRNTGGVGLFSLYDTDGSTVRADMGPGGFGLYDSSGNGIASIGKTSAGYGSLSLRDGNKTRCIVNDGGAYWYDSAGTLRCHLNPTSGLKFYDSSGNWLKTWYT